MAQKEQLSKVRILQLIDSLEIGGAERMCVNISNSLARNGNTITLCATRNEGPLINYIDRNIVKYSFLNKKSGFDLAALIRLNKLCRKEGIEIIHAHSSSLFWACLIKLSIPSLHIIWHDHFGESEKLIDTDRKLYKFISPLLFGIIAVNEILQDWSIRNMKVSKDRIVFLRNFPLINAINKRISPDNQLKIICIANFRPQKDHLTLIRAFYKVIQKHPEYHLELFMAGIYHEQDQYYRSITELISEYQLEEKVKVLGPVNEVENLLADADIGVLSSISEGLPVALLEYGLAGLPVVATSVGQCSEVLDNGNAGWLVEPGDGNLFADALVDLIEHKEKAKEKSKNLKELVQNQYGPAKFLKEYYSLIGRDPDSTVIQL